MATRTIEERLASIEASFATKEDLAKLETRLIKWLVVVQFLGLGAIAAIMRFLGG